MLGDGDDLVQEVLEEEELCHSGKDSPTPDRESIHIDVVVTQEEDGPLLQGERSDSQHKNFICLQRLS
jgi:hypothetical protein